MSTLQQCGVRRPMDLAGRTAETAARSPKFLSCGCHFDPRAALGFVSGCHCELTLHAPRLIAAEGEVGDEEDPKVTIRLPLQVWSDCKRIALLLFVYQP